MKKKLIIFGLMIGIVIFSNAQVVKIPDTNFKNYLLNNKDINVNGDKEIQVSEAESFIGTIDCSNQKIKNLTGIEAFINITQLDCSYNLLINLDVSKNVALNTLECVKNKLIKLDTSKNVVLNDLRCDFNQLTNLDVSKNTGLNYLMFRENQLTKLDVSNNKNLILLLCNGNKLTELDVSKNLKLRELDSQNNPNLKNIKVDKYKFLSNNKYWKKDETVSYIMEEGEEISAGEKQSTFQESLRR